MIRRKGLVLVVAVAVFMTLALSLAGLAFAQAAESPATAPAATGSRDMLALAVALAVGLSCLGAGYAVAKVGSAALGAASERPELLFRSLVFVVVAEGIAIYGFVISIMLMGRL